MTAWPVRVLLNTVYAWLAEQADALDRVRSSALLAAGMKPGEVEKMSRRAALDRWLNAPSGAESADEARLLKHLGAAS